MNHGRVWQGIAGAGLLSLLVSCEARPTPPPATATIQAAAEPFSIRNVDVADLSASEILDELRLQVYRYDFDAAVNHRAYFWLEVWRDGKIDKELSQGYAIQPAREKPLHGRVILSFMDGESMNTSKSRWSTRLELHRTASSKDVGVVSSSLLRWVDDPLKAKGMHGWTGQSFPINGPVVRGRTYTLRGNAAGLSDDFSMGDGGDTAKVASLCKVALFVRLRIDRIPSAQLRDSSSFDATTVPPEPSQD